MDSVIYLIKSTLANEIAASGFPLIYKGEMNHQIMRSFAFMANRKIAEMNVPTATRKRVFHIMIECLQNITNIPTITMKRETDWQWFVCSG